MNTDERKDYAEHEPRAVASRAPCSCSLCGLPIDNHPRCPNCGYTYCDCQIQGDHRLCGHPTPEKPTANIGFSN